MLCHERQRSGNHSQGQRPQGLVFAVMALLFTAAWVIRYPDLVRSSFRLTSVNAPKSVLARSEGRLVRLFARERADVQTGTVLAWLENTADHAQVLQLKKVLINLQRATCRGNLEPLRHLDLTTFHSVAGLRNEAPGIYLDVFQRNQAVVLRADGALPDAYTQFFTNYGAKPKHYPFLDSLLSTLSFSGQRSTHVGKGIFQTFGPTKLPFS